jgi:curved DNA-binding protein CbpA
LSRTPKLVPLPPGKMKSLPLAPVEGFILSRIDGSATERDIINLTGLDAIAVTTALDKLVSLGVIAFDGQPAERPKPEPRPSNIPPRPIEEVSDVTPGGVRKAPPGLYDPAELDEDVELSREHKAQILDRFHQLDDLDHYTLLGVARGADKKAVKRAYYEAAGLFHPDRFFRKRLGSFKPKMEALFSRVTIAHDTLADPERRADYDGYLQTVEQTKALEHELESDTNPPLPRADVPSSPSLPPAPASGMTLTGNGTGSERPARTSTGIVSEQARRDALARRLLGGRTGPPPTRVTTPPAPAPASDPDALRRHYEERLGAVRDRLSRDHIQTARDSAANGDWVGATTAYRLALHVSPNDADIRKELQEAQGKAGAILGEQYKKQAHYEEKAQDWAAAAKSWARAAKALGSDPDAHERAANALRLSDGNLHEAAQHALKAIELNAQRPKYRVTLAEVYVAAGLPLNARRELEAAAQLAPDDGTIQALMKKVKAK